MLHSGHGPNRAFPAPVGNAARGCTPQHGFRLRPNSGALANLGLSPWVHACIPIPAGADRH